MITAPYAYSTQTTQASPLPATLSQLQLLPTISFTRAIDSFGFALAKTMAAGVAVVEADIPTFRRLLDDGEAGILVPPHDSDTLATVISAVLNDDSCWELLSS